MVESKYNKMMQIFLDNGKKEFPTLGLTAYSKVATTTTTQTKAVSQKPHAANQA
jgi:hypothetical protein